MRRPSVRRAALLLLLLLSVLGSASSVLGEGATPSPFPLTPDPTERTTAPRPRGFFEPFVGRDPATPMLAAQPEHPMPYPPPAGEPADALTVAEVEATIRMGVACLNALDFPRLFAVHSDGYLERALGANPPTTEVLDMLFSPSAPFPPELREAIVSIRDVTLLADGRLAAVYLSDELASEPGYEYHLLILVREDGRLRIDIDHKTHLPPAPPLAAAPA